MTSETLFFPDSGGGGHAKRLTFINRVIELRHGVGVNVGGEVGVPKGDRERRVPRELHYGDEMNVLHHEVTAIGVAIIVLAVSRLLGGWIAEHVR